MVYMVVRFCNYFITVVSDIVIPTVWSAWKYVLRHFTGQSELERIVSSADLSTFERNERLKRSLARSRSLNKILDSPLEQVGFVVQLVIREKFSTPVKSMLANRAKKNGLEQTRRILAFQEKLNASLSQIIGYEELKRLVEISRMQAYDSRDRSHESKLLRLWSLLLPDSPLERRVTDQWSRELGFQGADPATDFRGMGLLGLDQLLFMADAHTEHSKRMMNVAKHPTKGYPFAIVGISMTSLVRDLLTTGALQRYFALKRDKYGSSPRMDDVHIIYCTVFRHFDQFWYKSEPSSIMDYSTLRDSFYRKLYTQLNTDEGSAAFLSLNETRADFSAENGEI